MIRKTITIKQVAENAGVSKQTVSRVLNNRPDVAPETRNLDPVQVEAMITTRRTGFLDVRVLGRLGAVGALTEIAARHSLNLVFDASHAFGTHTRAG